MGKLVCLPKQLAMHEASSGEAQVHRLGCGSRHAAVLD
jgi:hypothetical protein